jgi:fucose permease
LPTAEKISGAFSMLKNKALWLCLFAIFVGGASEVTMAQWCSSYLEQLGIDKIWGDIFGAAAFAVMLGLGRTLYAKYGNNIEKVLFFSGVGATVCYLVCILSPLPIIGLVACAMTGLCTAMMWPGSLVVASNKLPSAGVFVFALMAAGGDLGASVGPQLVGIVTDAIVAFNGAANWAQSLGLTVEQLAMKLGLAVGLLFPLLSIFVFLRVWRMKDKTTALPLSK